MRDWCFNTFAGAVSHGQTQQGVEFTLERSADVPALGGDGSFQRNLPRTFKAFMAALQQFGMLPEDSEDSASRSPRGAPSPRLVAARAHAPSLTDLPPEHCANEGCVRALYSLGLANFSQKGMRVAANSLKEGPEREEFQRISGLQSGLVNMVHKGFEEKLQEAGHTG
jgi:hypothetical protein